MNIAILDDYQDAIRKLPCAALLNEHNAKVYTNNVKGVGQLAVRLRDTEVVVLTHQRTSITKALVEKLPKLRLIVQTGSCTSNIDLDACTERGIAVCSGVAAPHACAELTWGLVMACMRRIPQYISHLKHGAWQQSGMRTRAMPDNFGLGGALRGKVLGVWTDDIEQLHSSVGYLITSYGRTFGMRVVVWGSSAARTFATQNGLEVATSKDNFLDISDVLCLHPNVSINSEALLSLADLGRMKPTALLVNTSHAALIATDDLVAALNRGSPGMAAIDVYDSEPPAPGQTLLRVENCVCTPHIGAVELEALQADYEAAFATINAFAAGQHITPVNPKALLGRM